MNRDDAISGRECRRVRELLSERLDRPLEANEARRLTEHLAGCPGCMQFERRLGRGMQLVAALPGATADPAVREAVLRRATGSRRRAILGQGAKLAGAAAAFGLIGLLLAAILRPGGGDDGTTDGFGSGSGPGETPTTAITPTPADEPVVAPTMPCAMNLLNSVDQALTISSTPNGSVIWFQATIDPALCDPSAPATVTLNGPDGAPLAIEGNGLVVGLIGDGEANVYSSGVLWLNWCGQPGPFQLALGIGSETHNMQIKAAPGCDDPNQPSKLAAAPPNEIAPDWPRDGLACGYDQLTWNVDTLISDGSRLITLKASPSTTPCLLEGEFVVTLRDAQQQPLDIGGNGLTLQVTGLVPFPGGVYSLSWTNWCGDRAEIGLTIDGASSGTAMGPIDPPECTDPAQPSELRQIADPDPTVPEATEMMPVCPHDAYVYMLSSEGAAGTRYTLVSIVAMEKTECAINEKFTVQINDASGIPLEINGNVATVEMNVPLGALADTWVAWTNWCGEAGMFQVTVNTGTDGWTTETESPPCVTPEQPSELVAGSRAMPVYCPLDQLSNELGSEGIADTQHVIISISGPNETTCMIVDMFTVQIVDANGVPLEIDGNGQTATIDEYWPPVAELRLIWTNWCGETGPFTATATNEADTLTSSVSPPPCIDPQQPSVLRDSTPPRP